MATPTLLRPSNRTCGSSRPTPLSRPAQGDPCVKVKKASVYPRAHLVALGLPGFAWVALFVAVAIYGLFATAFGTIDPLLFQPKPSLEPAQLELHDVPARRLGAAAAEWRLLGRRRPDAALRGASRARMRARGLPGGVLRRIARAPQQTIPARAARPAAAGQLHAAHAGLGRPARAGRLRQQGPRASSTAYWLGGRPSTVVLALIYGWVPTSSCRCTRRSIG